MSNVTPYSTASDPDEMNVAFAVLSNARRRYLLRELRRGETAELRALATRIVAHEREIPAEEVESKAEKSAYVSLYQTHVPQLADHGIVEYDRDAKEATLVRNPLTDRLLRTLDGDDPDRSTGRSYAVLAAVGAVLVVAAALAGGAETTWQLIAAGLGVVTAGVAATEGGAGRDAGGEPRAGLQAGDE